MPATYSITYDVTTPESAEQGDYAEYGFEVEPTPLEPGDLRRLIGEFRRAVEASSSHPRPGDWWTEHDGSIDLRTCAETRRSLHIDGITAATFRRIDRALRPERS